MTRRVKKALTPHFYGVNSGRSLRGPVTDEGSRSAKTRISSKHQVTISKQAFDEAGLHSGDIVEVRAVGPGRVELTRLDELFAKHRGRVRGSGDSFNDAIEEMRNEWD